MTALVLLRGEDPPSGSAVVVRGGERSVDAEILRRTATHSFEEFGFYGISVFAVVDGTLEALCSSLDQVRRYRQIRLSTVARLHERGFALLATGRRPHFDVVLADLDDRTLERLPPASVRADPIPGVRGDVPARSSRHWWDE